MVDDVRLFLSLSSVEGQTDSIEQMSKKKGTVCYVFLNKVNALAMYYMRSSF